MGAEQKKGRSVAVVGLTGVAAGASQPVALSPEECGCRSQNECCAPGFPGCRRGELPRSLERDLRLASALDPSSPACGEPGHVLCRDCLKAVSAVRKPLPMRSRRERILTKSMRLARRLKGRAL